MGPIERYVHYKRKEEMDMRWKTVPCFACVTIPIDEIWVAAVVNKKYFYQRVSETPHYKLAKCLVEEQDSGLEKAKAEYIRYILGNWPQPIEGVVPYFEQVLKYYKDPRNGPFAVVYYEKSLDAFVVADGVHRSSIALALGYKCIRCSVTRKAYI